jgi:hypothetical protein
MAKGGGQTGSKFISEMPDSHARVLPRSLQERRRQIKEAKEQQEREERERERQREEADEIRRRAQMTPALRLLQDHGITGTSTDMKKAFRRFALENHPDKQDGKPQAEKERKQELFKAVSSAYDTITGRGGRRTRKRRMHKRKHTHRRR